MGLIKKSFPLGFILLVILIAGFYALASNCYVVPIMTYHHVTRLDVPQPNTVSPQNFERHMAYLKKHQFHVIRLDTLVNAIQGRRRLPRKSVVITFDDGNEDNYANAFPILKKYQFPATIFVISDLVNADGYLSAQQMKEMSAYGIDIGSHTRGHPYLPELSSEDQRNEIHESKRRLEKELGVPVKYFAYPSGGFTEQIKRFVREAGYEGACTTNRGSDRWNRDVFELKRIRFSDKDNRPDSMWIKLSGFYNLFRKSKNSN